MTVRLRPATAEDWDVFRTLYESVAAEGLWLGAEMPVDWESRRPGWDEAVASDRWSVELAEADAVPVGWMTAELARYGRTEIGMGIVDGYRSQGIGTQLLAAALAWSRTVGAHKVTLQVWPHNERAIGLYRKFGFELEGRLRRHWRRADGALWDAVVMGLVLDEQSPGGP
ncbi:MAG: GNAT family N-acetyltransferase [Acidimicrobiia bacterium]